MKAKELIERLQKLPLDYEVVVFDDMSLIGYVECKPFIAKEPNEEEVNKIFLFTKNSSGDYVYAPDSDNWIDEKL